MKKNIIAVLLVIALVGIGINAVSAFSVSFPGSESGSWSQSWTFGGFNVPPNVVNFGGFVPYYPGFSVFDFNSGSNWFGE